MYKNRFTATDEMLKEFINKVLCKKIFFTSKVFGVCGIAMIIVSALGNDMTGLAMFAALTCVVVGMAIFTPKLTFNQMKKADKEINGNNKFETVVEFKNKVIVDEGAFHLELEFDRIRRIHTLKTCAVLMFTSQNGIIISKDGFEKGTYEEFLKFLKQKNPRVSIK